MLSSHIKITNFKEKYKSKKVKKILNEVLKDKNQIIESLGINYKNKFVKKKFKNYKKFLNFRVIGMGGSSLGAHAIYDFLKHKIKKNFYFIDNLQSKKIKNKKKYVNIVVSKSGNTIETITNSNILIKKKR